MVGSAAGLPLGSGLPRRNREREQRADGLMDLGPCRGRREVGVRTTITPRRIGPGAVLRKPKSARRSRLDELTWALAQQQGRSTGRTLGC